MGVFTAGLPHSAIAKPAPPKSGTKVTEKPLGKFPERILDFKVSPDGKRVAYTSRKGGKWLAIVDGQAGPEHDRIMEGSPIFSPDGKRLAYGTQEGKKRFIVLDGQAGPAYDEIAPYTLIFSPAGVATYLAVRDGVLFRVTSTDKP